jgi:hypothetical protein
MQLSHFFRRGVVLPLNAEAQIAMAHNDVDENTAARRISLDDDDLFYRLLVGGLFQKINKRTGSVLDEYEDESIGEPTKLVEIIKLIDHALANSSTDVETRAFVSEFREMCSEAIDRRVSVFFVL